MIYEVIKTGLTAFNRVFVEGEKFSEEEAAAMGLDVWYKETQGVTWAGKFIDLKESGKKKEAKAPVVDEESTVTGETLFKESGLTIEAFKKLTWQQQCKAFKGMKLAKMVKTYVESNDS